MGPILKLNQFSLVFDSNQASWSIHNTAGSSVSGLKTGLVYHLEGQNIDYSPEAWELKIDQQTEKLAQASAYWTAPGGLEVKIIFQLTTDTPSLVCWKMHITNKGLKPVQVDKLELSTCGEDGQPWSEPRFEQPSFFSNGWQSWSYTGAYQSHEKPRYTHLRSVNEPLLYDPAAPRARSPGHFVSNMFGIIGCRRNRQGILAGFLSQQENFGFVECVFDPISFNSGKKRGGGLAPVMRLYASGDGMVLSPGEETQSDWACLQFVEIDSDRPIDPYLRAVAALHNLDNQGRRHTLPPDISTPASGWCSWYYFFQDISEENLKENLRSAEALVSNLPLELFQIDDGFEMQVGDWYDFRPGFPNGIAPLSSEIRKAGFIPGLWLAPFILQPSAKIIGAHPEWVLRDQRGRAVNAGFLWNQFTHALDISHPEALDYAAGIVRTAVHDWGFDFLKLDFLYAGALAGRRYNPKLTRAQILRRALQSLRDSAGDETVILGCGCPLGSAVGLVDVMRISPDVSPRWNPSVQPIRKISHHLDRLLFDQEINLPAARNAIHDTLTRLPLHQRWWINDPDCLVLRETSELTVDEVQTLATVIALSAGQLLLSDNLPALTSDRLRIAQTMFPLLPESARAIDWFESGSPQHLRLDLSGPVGKWWLEAFFNWNETPIERFLKPEHTTDSDHVLSIAHDFWNNEIIYLNQQTQFTIQPHGVRLFAVRQTDPDQPAYVGSDLHISQGLEIREWSSRTGAHPDIRFTLNTHVPLSGRVTLYLPWKTDKVQITNEDQKTSQILKIQPDQALKIHLQCGRELSRFFIQPANN